MLNIVCVNQGNYEGRGSEYVNVLFDMVRRNLAEGFPGKYVCFTDDPTGLVPGIEARELPHGLHGWWNKLYLFKSGLFPPGDRILYFDLDTLICGRLDEIAGYDGEFAILRDLFHGSTYENQIYNKWQSAVMAWKSGFGSHLWDRFVSAGYPNIKGGDQAWIEQNQDTADILQDLHPNLFCSFKATGRRIPKTESVVCFHGTPRPHEVLDGWVPQVWRIGGFAKADLDSICNTENEKIHANIRHCVSLNLQTILSVPDHDRHVCIIGGGPSLAETLPEIRAMREFGHEIWALNQTHDWLIERGIIPSAMFMLDARPENAEFVKNARGDVIYYIASQCHPDVFRCLQGKSVATYHNATDGALEVLEPITDGDLHLLGGGTTVGMKAMVAARSMGFKHFHLYGFDSSYRDEEGHAYPQALNDNERMLDISCEGRQFKCAPWMAVQANEFIELARMFVQQDCLITVAGDGLIPHIARTMAKASEPDNRIVLIDGLWWPSKDRDARPFILDRSTDIAYMVKECRKFDVAIQAGGNVGVWPELMGRRFKSVYTFEPDWLNFQCLARNSTSANVIRFQSGLGEHPGMVGMVGDPLNCGALHVHGNGNIPILRLDDLNLPDCDLIQLDVEGYELSALKGALQTIRKFWPVIVIEENGSSIRYGIKAGETGEWLESLGYKAVNRIHRDIIYRRAPSHDES